MAIASWTQWGIFALVGYVLFQWLTHKGRLKLPPGPRPLPVLGNILDFPPTGKPEHEHWMAHKALYGGISSVTIMGMTLVIIHDKRLAHELLEKTAAKTSGRPTMVMANKLCGYESIILCQDSRNPAFRRYRKYLHQELGTTVSAAQFRDVQEMETGRHLVRALKEPKRWLEHCKTNAAATVLKMAYGYTIEPRKPDKLVDLIEKMMTEFSLAAAPMAWAVDIFPALQYLPEGFPGAGFKTTARRWRQSIQTSAMVPYRFVQRQMAALTYRPSYVSKLVQQLQHEEGAKLSHEDEEAVIWTAASLYGAAADTTTITLTTFTLAMIEFGHVQRKAQDEIDRIVGTDRLPTFEDRDKLPYINALVKEALRWWPIAPMGFPHAATEDIELNGLRIPKGAYILPAVYWFLHDPEVHADPECFDPDRFLPPRNEPDPAGEAFGYGRRKCPGRFFADSSLYLAIVQSLSAFAFTKAMGRDGKEVEVVVKPKPGILAYPTEFDFQIKPRSEKHAELIRQLERQYPWEESDAGLLDSIEGLQ